MPPPTKGAVGEVVGDNLYIACGNVCRLVKPNTNDLYKLDLNTWIWHKLEPRGTKPLESCFMASWVRGEKIFIFGGAVSGEEVGAGYPDALDIVDCYSNQLVYYDTQINSWHWPTSSGKVPPPRAHHAVSYVEREYKGLGPLAFVFGGYGRIFQFDGYYGKYYNDLFYLDMDTMKWEAVHANTDAISSEMWPKARKGHSLTAISSETAVLFGGSFDYGTSFGDCWLLNIGECTSKGKVEDIWTKCTKKELEGLCRTFHEAVREPNSGRVWIIGGCEGNNFDNFNLVNSEKTILCADHVREIAFSAPPLKVLALESAANNYEKLVPAIMELPDSSTLRLSVVGKARRKYLIT